MSESVFFFDEHTAINKKDWETLPTKELAKEYIPDGFVVRFPDFEFPKSETAAENSEDEERRARLFREAVEGAREDAKAMKEAGWKEWK